jgi:glutamine synthetase
MSSAESVLQLIADNDIEFVIFRFTDPRGKWQQVRHHRGIVNADTFNLGVMMDGSSIAGWQGIEESDLILMPDPSTAVIDPFTEHKSLAITCNTVDPETGEPYGRCPRQIALRAERHLAETGVANKSVWGPEPEFFIFQDVQIDVSMNQGYYRVDDYEGPYNSSRDYEQGNLGHRPGVKRGYFPVPPVDNAEAIRAEMMVNMVEMGVAVEKDHHEVAPSQHELGFVFDTLVKSADLIQVYKYVVHNTAQRHGVSATFMPKPILNDNGNGMHIHQSLWNDDEPVFAGDDYGGLSETALFYIGGIIKHGHAINAFTNPSTNSYKRLRPGFEAPIHLTYSARNRSAAFRIPHSTNPKHAHFEVRFPDATANPYLAYSALLMAGLDGIANRIHPGEPAERDLFDPDHPGHGDIKQVVTSLHRALDALEEDQEFLTKGGVFSEDFIASYIALKREEQEAFEATPCPIEFQMYYSV